VDKGYTPLHYAAEQGNFGVVQLLMSKGADIFIKDDNGESPRDLAAALNYQLILELFDNDQ